MLPGSIPCATTNGLDYVQPVLLFEDHPVQRKMTDTQAVKNYLLSLQANIVAALEAADGHQFISDSWERPDGGGGISRVIEEGHVFERGGVNFSHVMGNNLPPSAAASRPELAGRKWEAMGVSLVLHPRNPYAPTVHMNVRFFTTHAEGKTPSGGLAAVWI